MFCRCTGCPRKFKLQVVKECKVKYTISKDLYDAWSESLFSLLEPWSHQSIKYNLCLVTPPHQKKCYSLQRHQQRTILLAKSKRKSRSPGEDWTFSTGWHIILIDASVQPMNAKEKKEKWPSLCRLCFTNPGLLTGLGEVTYMGYVQHT